MMKSIFNIELSHNYISVIFVLLLSSLVHAQEDESWKIFSDNKVAEIKIYMDGNDFHFMYDNVQSDSIHPCTVYFKNSFISDTVNSVGIRLRGNTSRLAQKKSFKLSFNTFNPGSKFYNLEKLNLNGEHNDPSISRSKICWDLFNEIGVFSSRAAYAAVYINDNYMGLYINVEHIDENFIDKNFDNPNGNLWKCLYGADLNYINDSPNSYKIGGTNRVYDLKTNTNRDDYSKLADFISFINNSDAETFKNFLVKEVDLLSLLQVFAVDVLTGMWDDYWGNMNNYYLYHNPADDKFYFIPYDYDNTFGVNWFSPDWAFVNPYIFGKITDGYRPLIERTLEVPEFHNLYTKIINTIIENIDSTSMSNYRLYLLQSGIRPYAESDLFKSYDYGFTNDDFNQSFFTLNYSNQHVQYSIQEFINNRINSLNSQLYYKEADPLVYDYEVYPRLLSDKDTLTAECSAFSIRGIKKVDAILTNSITGEKVIQEMLYTAKQSDIDFRKREKWINNFTNFKKGFVGTISFVVEDSSGLSIASPNEVKIRSANEVSSEVLLSELMSSNTSVIADNVGEYDDWLEIYNPQDTTVDLSGKYLTDKRNNLTKWQFPSNVYIAPKQHILIWCDEDQEQAGPHINFKLSSSGEFVAIVDNDGITIVDSVTLPALNENESYARVDNIGDWFVTSNSTPGTNNTLVSVEKIENVYSNSVSVYPNPFNPTSVVEYEISSPSKVKLALYDILGREIWEINKEHLQKGKFQVELNSQLDFNGKLTSGVYFLKFNSKTLSKTIKLVYLK